MTETKYRYSPDAVTPPGSTLAEALEERGITQTDFAQRIEMSRKHVKQILDGEAPITSETALKFERALGVPARFWNTREQIYRDYLARQAELKDLENHKEWLRNFKQISSMMKMGWLPNVSDPIEKIRALLDFFGTATPEAWERHWKSIQVQYRKSTTYEPDPYALAAWLRRGEVKAQEIACRPYDESAFRRALLGIRGLTLEPPEVFQSELTSRCADCGVAVVFVRELPKTASGATRWLTPRKALIQLSLKYKTDDHLWFTFFHEAGHIVLHPKKDIFIEDKDVDSDEEEEANRFAVRTLIPLSEFEKFCTTAPFTKAKIRSFARRQGIAPGIVVGQLQHRGLLPYTHCNELKRKFEWITV